MPTSISTSGIAAEAFRLIELNPGSSLQDGTEHAIAAAEQYASALAECLEIAEWSFAAEYTELAAAILPGTAKSDPSLPYFFLPPGDCLRLVSVGDDWTSWRLDAIGLRANDPAPLPIRYVKRVVSEDRMPATFKHLVALTLAIRLAPLYQTNSQKLEQLRDMHMKQRVLALRQDARMASDARADDLDAAEDWVRLAIR